MHALARLAIESELAVAVERHELELRFHPVVSISSGEITGFEALVRWRHPTRGILSPVQFIAQAERTDDRADRRGLLREAASQLAAWQRAFPRPPASDLSVSVNVSMRASSSSTTCSRFESTIDESGSRRARSGSKVSEASLGEVSSSIARAFEGLRALGVRVSIDDFGAGDGSPRRPLLAAVRCGQGRPILRLRRQRRSLSAAGGRRTRQEPLPQVVVEGVETGEHATRIREAGCDLAQGFDFFDPWAGTRPGRSSPHAPPPSRSQACSTRPARRFRSRSRASPNA